MKKQILVAPLNWGLGHATRCIPIINALINEGFSPVIASDGDALTLLKKEFPNVSVIELPAYDITYSKNSYFFKLKLLTRLPKIFRAIKAEQRAVYSIIKHHNITGIISDNRLGVRHKKIPSVYITHQLNVLSGYTTWYSTKIHQKIIKKFDTCWVPDVENHINLSGKLGHAKSLNTTVKFIGPLSRFNKIETEIKNDLLVLISGPEPQRSLLEKKLLFELTTYSGKVVFVKGLMAIKQSTQVIGNITVYNFMTSELLEKTINESALILSRPGYTTIMDLSKLNKKAFFIPTPGQLEQEYLAKRLKKMNLAPSCSQNNFTINKLSESNTYKGLKTINFKPNYNILFSLFLE